MAKTRRTFRIDDELYQAAKKALGDERTLTSVVEAAFMAVVAASQEKQP